MHILNGIKRTAMDCTHAVAAEAASLRLSPRVQLGKLATLAFQSVYSWLIFSIFLHHSHSCV